MKARTQEIDGLREKRVWFQRKESLVSEKREFSFREKRV
jgi:hypothetical protein